METLILHPTATAQWHSLINDAKRASAITLSEELESYLVFLLMRFSENPEIVHSVMATDYLESMYKLKNARQNMLREVGDKCLLFAGLFPGRARKRRVRISYYVNLGKTAYFSLSESYINHLSTLFAALGDQFVGLMDVLHNMRELTSQHFFLDLLQAEELWNDIKSEHALKTLQNKTQGFILSEDSGNPSKYH